MFATVATAWTTFEGWWQKCGGIISAIYKFKSSV